MVFGGMPTSIAAQYRHVVQTISDECALGPCPADTSSALTLTEVPYNAHVCVGNMRLQLIHARAPL